MRIALDGDHITVVHNNKTIIDGDGHSHPELLNRSARGPIGLQNHRSKVWFRNIRLADLSELPDRESWRPEILSPDSEHYLPDFSYAGYHWGEEPLPYRTSGTNIKVTDFGAVPNDSKDDTEAILKAVAKAHETEGPVAITFPCGNFILRDIMWIERSNLVIRGAGKDKTVIKMATHLGKMNLSPEAALFENQKKFNDSTGRNDFSPFSWLGGLIWTHLPEGTTKTALHEGHDYEPLSLGIAGKRGQHTVTVKPGHTLEPGLSYRLVQYNKGPEDSLLKHLHEWDGPGFGSWIKTVPVHMDLTVTAIDGETVTLKEPLLHDLRPEWEPTFFELPCLTEVGIESLRFECPNRKSYGGHHKEKGYNPIYMTNVRHGWIRDVALDNADTGITLSLCSNVTVQTCSFTDKLGAHYAMQMAMGCRNLVHYVRADVKAIHTLSFNTGERGSVYTHCGLTMPRLDQHCGINHQNLFDDVQIIHAEPGWGLFIHGGGSEFFPLHGAFNTFWNVRLHFDDPSAHEQPIKILASSLPAPAARLVGFTGNAPVEIERYHPDPYIEGTNKPYLAVPSLYEYQLTKRLKGN